MTHHARSTAGQPREIAAPASMQELADAESSLGFTIPALLNAIYREVGNGGFGPGYGLLGLKGGATNEHGHDAVALFDLYSQPAPNDPSWRWPDGLLPICGWGCAIYSCVDCKAESNPIIIFDPNQHPEDWDRCFINTGRNLVSWFDAWADGVDLREEIYGKPDHIFN
jgi:hypothetical protein